MFEGTKEFKKAYLLNWRTQSKSDWIAANGRTKELQHTFFCEKFGSIHFKTFKISDRMVLDINVFTAL